MLTVQRRIIRCTRCPRLRDYCERIAREKRAAFRGETYWGKPLPGFGDPHARVLVVGLAPAAHGGNRTGRVFTGDSSGNFLMRAMHAAGFANQPSSVSFDDGLILRDAWILAAARCAPPDNKPTPQELANCQIHFEAEWSALPHIQVVVALGRIAFDACWRVLAAHGTILRPRPPFGHGVEYRVTNGPIVLGSYHPSQQNTFTGKLTRDMLAGVFMRAREALREQ